RLPRRALGLLALSLVVAVLLLTTIRYEHPPFGIQDLLSRLRPFQESSPNSHRTNKMSQPVKRTAAVIFSHGLGDSSAGWSFLAEQLGSVLPWVNCFPDAPLQPVTLNMGAKMQSWFDILGLRPDAPEDEKGLLESVKTIQSLVDKQIQAGIPSERIVVGGFSQGGAISILTGLMSPSPLAGVACLSGFLTLKDKIKQLQGPHASQLNVFWGHGTSDPVVQYQWGSKSVDFLKEELGLTNVDFKSYPDLVHSASPLELKQLSEWLLTRLPNQ
ncbi:hypothetical protein MJO29_013245, partial [Puccinia striiformis f. sp. tritici]